MFEEVEYPPIEPEYMDTSDIVEDEWFNKYLAAIDYINGAGIVVVDWGDVRKELRRYLYGE